MLSLHNEEPNTGRDEALVFPSSQPKETNGLTFSPTFHCVQEKVEHMSLLIRQVHTQQQTSEDAVVEEIRDLLLELQGCLPQSIEAGSKRKPKEAVTLQEQTSPEAFEDYTLAREILKQRVRNIRPLLNDFEQSFGLLKSKTAKDTNLEYPSAAAKIDGIEKSLEIERKRVNGQLTSGEKYLGRVEILEREVLSKVAAIESQIMSNSTLIEADKSLIEDQFTLFHESFKSLIHVKEIPEPEYPPQSPSLPSLQEDVESVESSHREVELIEAAQREDELTNTILVLNQQFEEVQKQLFESQQHETLLQSSFTTIHAENVQLNQKNEELMRDISEMEKKYAESLLEAQSLQSSFENEISIYNDKVMELEEQLGNTQICLKEYENHEAHFYSMAGAWNAEFNDIRNALSAASCKEMLLDSLISTMFSLQTEEIQDEEAETTSNDTVTIEGLNQLLEELKSSLKESKDREESLSLINHKMNTELEDGRIHLQLVVEHAETLADKLQKANIGQSYIDSVHEKLRDRESIIANLEEQISNFGAKETEMIDQVRVLSAEIQNLQQKLSDLNKEREQTITRMVDKHELQDLQEELLRTQEKLGTAEAKELEHNQIVAQLNFELEKTKGVLDSAFKKVELFDATIRDLSLQLEDSTANDMESADIVNLRSELDETVLLLAHSTEREAELENTISQLRSELERLEKETLTIRSIGQEEKSDLDSSEVEMNEDMMLSTLYELNQELNSARQVQFKYECTINLLESAIRDKSLFEESQYSRIYELQRELEGYDHKEKEYLKAMFDSKSELEKKNQHLLEYETKTRLLEAYINESLVLSEEKDSTISQLTEELATAEITENEHRKYLFDVIEELNQVTLTLVEQEKSTSLFESSVYEKLSEIKQLSNALPSEEFVYVSRADLDSVKERVSELESAIDALRDVVDSKNLEIQNLQNVRLDQNSSLEELNKAFATFIRSLKKYKVTIPSECEELVARENGSVSSGFDAKKYISSINAVSVATESWIVEKQTYLGLKEAELAELTKTTDELQQSLIIQKQQTAEREALVILLQKREHERVDSGSSSSPTTNGQEMNRSISADSVDSDVGRDDSALAHIDTTHIMIPEKLEAIDINNSRNSVSSLDHDRDSAVALDDESDGSENRKALPYSTSDLTNKLAEAKAQIRIIKASRRDMDDQLQIFKSKLKDTLEKLVIYDINPESLEVFVTDISSTLEDPTSHIGDIITCLDNPKLILDTKEESRRLTFGNISDNTTTGDLNSKQSVATRGRASTISGNSVHEISKLKKDLSLYASEVETLKLQKENYEKQCRSFQENIMTSQTREGKLNREVRELRSRLEAHKVESMNALTALQAKYRESLAEVEAKCKQQVEELEKELFVAKKRIIRLKEQVSSTEKVCADAVSLTEQLETELARTWKEKRTAEKQLLESQQRCEDLGKDLRAKELELISQKQSYDAKIKDMDLKIRDKVKSITIARRATIVNSPEKRGSFYQQLRSKWTGGAIDESYTSNPKAVQELEVRFQDEVDMHVATNRLLQSELAETQGKNAELEQIKEAIETQLAELRINYDQSERTLAKLRREADENQRATLVSLQRAQTEKQSSARIELANIQAERASQQRIISELKKELSNLRDEQHERMKELTSAKQEIEVLKRLSNSDENEGVSSILEVLTREKLILETKVNELETELDDVLTKNVDLAMQLAAIK
ncbi:hypothetical protein K493DRAFT_332631 [Basidiobolus meristosporus CBS 931.73]|uniref:Uncharacterized protein n=1 Tax=Basidiobolus meristosporus CBS 931.73 TaxID=1314790 RepID=A0A1Y1ZBP3_9FUNG|nr:hypothetical protein K493DRAFT_332631 [Basidiobolus meristosporus CBS 931.73]|eukprot:ORY07712.1 hypothetical protein K493DRAFT_332631 [Basidiobolus meristosporus CBS 931.73]